MYKILGGIVAFVTLCTVCFFIGVNHERMKNVIKEDNAVMRAEDKAAANTSSAQASSNETAIKNQESNDIRAAAYAAAVASGANRLRVNCPAPARVHSAASASAAASEPSADPFGRDSGPTGRTIDLDDTATKILDMGRELDATRAIARSCQADLKTARQTLDLMQR